ncbi:MAG: tetratricopeptide repeat protein [Xanthobacteraceae bacterium]
MSGHVTASTPAESGGSPGRGDIARAFQVATALHQQGKLPEAEQLYRRILAVDPEHSASLFRLGAIRAKQGQIDDAVLLLRRAADAAADSAEAQAGLGVMLAGLGRPGEAIACFDRALALNPNHPETHNNLGKSLHMLGRHEEAIAHFRTAIAINPVFAQAHGNLGIVLSALGRPEEALAHLARSVAITPGHADAHRNLADTLQRLGRYPEAIARYQTALAIRPDDAFIHCNLADALRKVGRFDEAIAHYRKASAIRPDNVDACNGLGTALMALNRNEEALSQFEQALAIAPSRAEAQNNIGVALQALGRFEEAGRAYERAVSLAPGNAAIHLNLAHAKPFTAGDPRLAAMEALAEKAEALGDDERIALHFALGKAWADLEEPDRSFRHLLQGNALKRRRIVYDEAAVLGQLCRIAAVFSPELMLADRGASGSSPVPVFVIGMPRSGTTLIEQILAGHASVFGGGEREDLGEAVARLGPPAFPEAVTTMSVEDLRRLGSDYLGRVTAAAPRAQRIVDRMPTNFKYAGLIHLALPNARIIHVARDPVDTCLSCFSLLFAGDQPYAYDLGELGRYYRAYEALMAHWRDVLPPGTMLEVRYEDVVDDLEGQARRIVAHAGLRWDDACLALNETQRPVATASAIPVRQPIHRGSVDRSHPYRKLLQPLLAALREPSSSPAP